MVKFNVHRLLKHLFFMPWQLRRDFPPTVADRITAAVRHSEKTHCGEVRFVVEGALHGGRILHGLSPRARALEVFSELRVWDTEHNNGILIYVLMADRQVEIIADRGIVSRVDPNEWKGVCRVMERAFGEGQFEHGSLEGIRLVSEHLAKHFPPSASDTNELPDAPVIR